jgi:hypothetical protein
MQQDYTTFTETDPTGDITVTPTQITVAALPATADAHVAKVVTPVADYSLSAKVVITQLEDSFVMLGMRNVAGGCSHADLTIDTDCIKMGMSYITITGYNVSAAVSYDSGATPLTFHLRMIRRGTACYHKVDQLVGGVWVNKVDYELNDAGAGPATRQTILVYGSTDDGGVTANSITFSELRLNNLQPEMTQLIHDDMHAIPFSLSAGSASHVASGNRFIVQSGGIVFVGGSEDEAKSQRFAIPANTPTRVKARGRLWLYTKTATGGYVRKEK